MKSSYVQDTQIFGMMDNLKTGAKISHILSGIQLTWTAFLLKQTDCCLLAVDYMYTLHKHLDPYCAYHYFPEDTAYGVLLRALVSLITKI